MQRVLHRWRENAFICWSGKHFKNRILDSVPVIREQLFFKWFQISFISYQALQKLTSGVEYTHREVMMVLKTRSVASGSEPDNDKSNKVESE